MGMSVYSTLILVVCSILLTNSRRNSAPFGDGVQRLYDAETGKAVGTSNVEVDTDPYHDPKFEKVLAYGPPDADKEEDKDKGSDGRLYAASTSTFTTAMSAAGASAVGVTAAVSASGLGGGSLAGAIALAGGPIGVGIAVLGVTVSVIGYSWDWDGIGWPWASWKNKQTLDLSDNIAYVWTEEGSGRVFAYKYANRADAVANAMNKWWCTRILVVWNRDKLVVEFPDKRGMSWARQTIMDTASGAYLEQFKKNIEDLVVHREITKAEVDPYLNN